MIAFVFRPKRRVKATGKASESKVCTSRTYSGRFRLAGDIKATTVPLGVSDKQVAEEKLRRIVRDGEREREGLAPPKEQREVAKRPMEVYVHEYVQSRHGLARDEKYVRELEKKLFRLMDECRWFALRDITGHSFEAWRASQSLSAKTLNEYHNAVLGLCNWLETRVGANPMRGVLKVNAAASAQNERRALTSVQLARLVEVSDERGISYLVAASTGIRRGELMEIQWRDVHLETERPYITVRASIAKNHKLADQPLPLEVAAALRQRRMNVSPTDFVFRRLIPRMNRFRKDLAAAGIAYVDEKGERRLPRSPKDIRNISNARRPFGVRAHEIDAS